MKKCPFCAEEIQDEAIICRYCNRDLPKADEPLDELKKAFTALEKSFMGYLLCWLICMMSVFLSGLLLEGNEIVSWVFALAIIFILLSRFVIFVNIIRIARLKKFPRFWIALSAIFFTIPTLFFIYISYYQNQNPLDTAKLPGFFRRVITIMVVLVGVFCIILGYLMHQNSENKDRNVSQATISTPTKKIRPTRTPTVYSRKTQTRSSARMTQTARAEDSSFDPNRDCYNWSSISLRDVGTTKCVYGTVKDQRYDETTLYLIFDADYEAFYFISYGDWYYPGLEGNCAAAYGEIRQLGQAPVMVIDNNMLKQCE